MVNLGNVQIKKKHEQNLVNNVKLFEIMVNKKNILRC